MICTPHKVFRVIKARRMRWAGHVARMEVTSRAYRVLVGKPKGRRPLGRPTRRWDENIEMDLQEVDGSSRSGMGSMGWIDLAQNRGSWRSLVNVVMNLRVP